jgi:hypothetical protein
MERPQILLVLEHIRSHSLRTASDYVSGHHLVSEDGIPLPPNHTSLHRVARNCVGGATIRSLAGTRVEPLARRFSPGYWAVMLELAKTLGFKGAIYRQVVAVQQFSDQCGYMAVHKLVVRTINRLEREGGTESAQP